MGWRNMAAFERNGQTFVYVWDDENDMKAAELIGDEFDRGGAAQSLVVIHSPSWYQAIAKALGHIPARPGRS